jgi:hypothetical protein
MTNLHICTLDDPGVLGSTTILQQTHVVEIKEVISRLSDGVSLGHETVTYAGPRYSRFMMFAYRKDHPR